MEKEVPGSPIKPPEKATGEILKSLIDKWQGRKQCLDHKDRHSYEDQMEMGIYKEVIEDLQKLG
jgi:hypothetical protein